MIFITDELGNIEKNILELVEKCGIKRLQNNRSHRFVLWHI